MRRTHEALTRSATHPAITDGDCRVAVRELGTLSPGQFRQAIDRMDHSGTLATLRDEAPWTVRRDFLRLCERNHVVTATQTPASAAPNDPPAGPRQLDNASTLPAPLRDMVHAHNNLAVENYREAYNHYVDRYVSAVGRAQSGADLRALGHPQPPHDTSEPGVDAGRDARYLDRGELTQHFHTLDGLRAVSERMHELRNEAPPGELRVRATVSGSAGLSTRAPGGTRLRREIAGEASLDVSTTRDTQAAATLTPRERLSHGDRSVTVGVSSSGDQTLGVDLARELGGTVTRDARGRLSGSVTTPVGGGSWDGHRLGLTTPSAGPLSGGAGVDTEAAHVDMSVTATGSRRFNLSNGVQGHASVEGSVRLDAQFLSRTDAVDAATRDTLERRPPELEAGRPWNDLVPGDPQASLARQQQLQRALWTQAEWEAALNR